MIKEEYVYADIKDYLSINIDILIIGNGLDDDRSSFFFNEWKDKSKQILFLNIIEKEKVSIDLYENNVLKETKKCALSTGIPAYFHAINIEYSNILIDLSSLSHILIMFLTKVLLKQVIPKSLFAAYIRPEKYHRLRLNCVDFSLSARIQGIDSVPGFVKRQKTNIEKTLCSFVGFEGTRLKSIYENMDSINRLIPIIAFPLGDPHWYNYTMQNCIEFMQDTNNNLTIHKCYSESIFEAIILLEKIFTNTEGVLIAPLGTRPHSMATAIFATKHPNVQIIHDFAEESENRTEGIAHISIYHLSSFLSIDI